MHTYDDISPNVFRMRYILFENCRENKKKLQSIIFMYENRALHGVIWKNMVSQTAHRWQYSNEIWRVGFSCRLAKATIPTHL